MQIPVDLIRDWGSFLIVFSIYYGGRRGGNVEKCRERLEKDSKTKGGRVHSRPCNGQNIKFHQKFTKNGLFERK